MDPISGTDRLVAILRQKLRERAQAGRQKQKASADETPPPKLGIRGLASVEGLDRRQLHRALIQNILADQFGTTLMNDAQFQQVVSRVTEVIETDPSTVRLLTELVEDLRRS